MYFIKQRYWILFFILTCLHTQAQNFSDDYKWVPVNRSVFSFNDTIDLSSPLSAFVTSMYNQAAGRASRFCDIATEEFRSFMINQKDHPVDQHKKEQLLKRNIYELILYKDSVAGIITNYDENGEYLIGYVNLEHGRWVNSGEDICPDIEAARKKIESFLPKRLEQVRRIEQLSQTPTDTIAFINYLREYGQEPDEFLLDALNNHKIVIYGETHFRKESWNFLKKVVRNKEFPKKVETIFLEQSVAFQPKLDRFFSEPKLEPKLLLDILGNNAYFGFEDRGLYEFLIEVWKVNQKLTSTQKIRVLATDTPEADQGIEWSEIQTTEDYLKTVQNINRDLFMFQTIENVIKTQQNRGNLFIVGINHAMKKSNDNRVATLLSDRFSPEEVFSVMVHTPVSDNHGNYYGLLRNGIFDYAFHKEDDKPVAFNLYNSPFGNQLFDRNEQIRTYPSSASYQDNYDGYIFLKPVEKGRMYLLYDLYSKKYIAELKRRAHLLNTNTVRGIPVDSLTVRQITIKLKRLKKENKERLQAVSLKNK